MFGGKAREYPHLVTYLHYATQEPVFEWTGSPRLTMAGLASAGAMFASIAIHMPILTVVSAAVLLPVAALLAKNHQKVETPTDVRQREAREVAVTMRKCLDLRRLHRDLDEGSLVLLEECARYWGRVKAAFDSGFWARTDLPGAYTLARKAALQAADEGMRDVLLLYRPNLPMNVTSRAAFDYVEEALEKVVFGGPGAGSHLPTAFGPAREIADRLRAVAVEAEQMAEDAGRERVVADGSLSNSLEATLGELRAIRQAEDELRQNLRG